jgi:hypothetical protein
MKHYPFSLKIMGPALRDEPMNHAQGNLPPGVKITGR